MNYLLSYERKIVEDALSLIQSCNGSEYLEKVVQVPIKIPKINQEKIADLLSKKLADLSNYTTTEQEMSDIASRASLLRYCLFPYIETIRDLRRFSNVLDFELAGSGAKVSPIDIAAISAISTFEPELIQWILANKNSLCGGTPGGYISDSKSNRESYKTEIEKVLRNKNSDPDNIVRALSVLFPSFGLAVSPFHPIVSTEFLRMHKMLAHDEIFDAYFASAIDSYDFPQALIHNMATKYDESEVSRIVEASFGNKNYGQLLEGFLGIADEIISARAPIVFRSFVHHIKKTYDPEHIALFSDNQRSIDLLNKLLATAGIDEASLLIREAVDNFDLEDFIAFRSFIIRQECACGRNGFEKNTLNAQLIDLETLEFVEQKLIQKTQESMNELSILGKEDAQGLLHIWERINPESYDHCLRQALNHPLGKVLLAQLYVSKWYGSHSNGWTIDKGFKVFVTEEKALAGIREAVLQEDFWSLPHSTIERTAAFAIGVENKQYEMNANEINESIVNERIRNWEKNRHLRNE